MSEQFYLNEGFYIRDDKLIYLKRKPTSFSDQLYIYSEESFLTPYYSKHVNLNELIKYEPLSLNQLKWIEDRLKLEISRDERIFENTQSKKLGAEPRGLNNVERIGY